MARIYTYLSFSGNSREAMLYYQQCLGGELLFQTVGQSPLSQDLPIQAQHCIVLASLSKDDWMLYASDLTPDEGLRRGNNMAICVQCNCLEELQQYYSRLSEQGNVHQSLTQNHWNTWFAELTDKYGNNWILTFHHQPQTK